MSIYLGNLQGLKSFHLVVLMIPCHYQNLLIINMSYGYELDNEKGACGGKCENLGVEEIQKAVRGHILTTSYIRFGIMTDKTTPYPA